MPEWLVVPQVPCSHCELSCERCIIDGKFHEVKMCGGCASLYCGFCCARSVTCTCKSGLHEYSLFSSFCIFMNNAPSEDLGLINLQVCRDERGSSCDPNHSQRYRRKLQQVVCKQCEPWRDYNRLWQTTEKIEHAFLMMIDIALHEWRSLRLPEDDGALPMRIVDHGALPMRIVDLFCTLCQNEIASRQLLIDGKPHCYECGTTRYGILDRRPKKCYVCLNKFIECIECIPENQLSLLTFSKWVLQIGCSAHLHILKDLTALSDDGQRKGKLSSFFKKEDSGENQLLAAIARFTTTSPTFESDIEDLPSRLPALVDTPTHVTPKSIVCLCGREEDISNVSVCNTCSVYGMCALCTIRKHSGHEYQDALKMATISFVNDQSELTLQKLRLWSVQAHELNLKSEKVFKKLCSALGATFKTAMINSEDHRKIQALLERTNTSTVEKFFKETVNSTMRLHKAIDYLCEELTDAVEKDKGIVDASLQEMSPSSETERKRAN